jgi:hypothetical protein
MAKSTVYPVRAAAGAAKDTRVHKAKPVSKKKAPYVSVKVDPTSILASDATVDPTSHLPSAAATTVDKAAAAAGLTNNTSTSTSDCNNMNNVVTPTHVSSLFWQSVPSPSITALPVQQPPKAFQVSNTMINSKAEDSVLGGRLVSTIAGVGKGLVVVSSNQQPLRNDNSGNNNVAAVKDMTMTVSARGIQRIVKDIVRDKLFRVVKFFDGEKHGFCSDAPNTVCGIVVRSCNVMFSSCDEMRAWWKEIRKTVIRTIADHRNNCIKAMRIQYRGKESLMGMSSFLFLPTNTATTQWLTAFRGFQKHRAGLSSCLSTTVGTIC